MSSLWPVGPSHPTQEENNDSNKKGTKVTAELKQFQSFEGALPPMKSQCHYYVADINR